MLTEGGSSIKRYNTNPTLHVYSNMTSAFNGIEPIGFFVRSLSYLLIASTYAVILRNAVTY